MKGKLELKFTKELENRSYEAKKACKYNPTRFLQMLAQHGGVDTAKKLIEAGGMSEGFVRLYEEGRLDLSMEAVVVEERFKSLFKPEEIEVCKNKLLACGYKM